MRADNQNDSECRAMPLIRVDDDGNTTETRQQFENRTQMIQYILAHGGGELVEPLSQFVSHGAQAIGLPKILHIVATEYANGNIDFRPVTFNDDAEPTFCIVLPEQFLRRFAQEGRN